MQDLAIEWLPLDAVQPYAGNPRNNTTAIPKVAESIKRYGWRQPIVVDAAGVIVAGHTRYAAALELGLPAVPVHRALDLSPEQAAAYRIADNRTGEEAVWDRAMLATELGALQMPLADLKALGFEQTELDKLLRPRVKSTYDDFEPGALARDYGVPPLTVLDARLGTWRDAKRNWMEQIGKYANATRENKLSNAGSVVSDFNSGVSVLDPFLAEIVCRWFARPGWQAFDPFAGDCVFGYVSATMGLRFTGIELRREQVDANRAALDSAGLEGTYICDDAANLAAHIEPASQDLLFSCPPYGDLEVYSNDPRDLSKMEHRQFLNALAGYLEAAAATLKEDRFAVIVVGECRGAGGGMIGIVPQVITAMQRAGLAYWNDLILATPIGTAAMRCRASFDRNRKVARTHQHVLVFYKGQPDNIRTVFGVEPARAVTWKISAAWASKPHDCTADGIREKCGGRCCRWDAWPPRSGVDNTCPMLGPDGCKLGENRPVTCHLYPLRLNKSGTLVKHHRANMTTGICGACANTGPPLIDAMRGDLTFLFGAEQYEAARAAILDGHDYEVTVPQWVLNGLAREDELEAENAPPEPIYAD